MEGTRLVVNIKGINSLAFAKTIRDFIMCQPEREAIGSDVFITFEKIEVVN